MLALDNDLISQYFAFQQGKKDKYDRDTIVKLFKYLQPFTISVSQKNEINLSDEIAHALSADGLIKIRNRANEDELIQKTLLKIMIKKDRVDGTYTYTYNNILDDEIDVRFSATYKSGENRDKVIEHLRALLLEATEINIYDRYLTKINHANDSWNINKNILHTILPQKAVDINIFCQYNWNSSRENDLSSYCADWSINKEPWVNSLHDRYITTDKMEILLSSGLINLSSTQKDFTYIVKIK